MVIILRAVLVINMITRTAIASQLLVTTKAKVTMLNTETNPDPDHDCDQGPVLVPLEAQDTVMVTTFIMMTAGAENSRVCPLLPLVQDLTKDRPLLEPNHLWFTIRIR